MFHEAHFVRRFESNPSTLMNISCRDTYAPRIIHNLYLDTSPVSYDGVLEQPTFYSKHWGICFNPVSSADTGMCSLSAGLYLAPLDSIFLQSHFKTKERNLLIKSRRLRWAGPEWRKVVELSKFEQVNLQDPEANIWTQEEWEWGVQKAPQWGTS